MKEAAISLCRRSLAFTSRVACTAMLTAVCYSAVFAQVKGDSPTDSRTPSDLAPGAPAGSFPLSGFDNVNLFNGNLNFALPLLKIGGRGEAGYTVTLKVERSWMATSRQYSSGPGSTGWSQPIYSPEPNNWNGIKPGFGPGVLIGRVARDKDPDPSPSGGNILCDTITRLTFIAADGTEFEFRDQQTDGRPHHGVNGAVYSRGIVFITKDGTGATFISDQPISDIACNDTSIDIMLGFRRLYPSGYLMLKNGIRYRIESGQVMWISDRNGNRITFDRGGSGGATYDLISATDSMGRSVTFSGDSSITYRGIGGVSRTISIIRGPLSQALRSDIPSVKSYKQLFPELNGSSESMVFDPWVVTAVVLPDGRQYTLKYNEYGELARVVLPTGASIEYDHGRGLDTSPASSGVINGNYIYRRVKERRIYKDGGTGASFDTKTTYNGTTETTYDSGGNILNRTSHSFGGDPLHSYYASYTSM